MKKISLLAGVALMTGAQMNSVYATTSRTTHAKSHLSARTRGASPVHATTPMPTPTGGVAPRPRRHVPVIPRAEEMSVIGRGATRQVQTMTASMMAQSVPGTNPLKLLGSMPGISYNSADPLGIDLWSQSFLMRGFSQDQLGFTLDGMPLGLQSYGSAQGLNVINAISQQNIQSIDVSQGAGAVNVPSSSNLGGVVQFHSIDPADTFGGKVSQTFGSYDSYLTFVRIDSGRLNRSGTKFFVSYSRGDEQKWKGSGSQFLQQVNTKLVQPFGESTKLTAFFDWDQATADTYADLSLENLHKLGSRVSYYYPDYAAAYRTALYGAGLPGGALPAGYNRVSDPVDASYYDGPATSHDYFGGATLRTDLTSHLNWTTTLYGQGKGFNAYWTNPYIASPSGAPLAEQDNGSLSQRGGLTSDFVYTIARNKIDVGVWYEHGAYEPFYTFYNEPVLGEGAPLNPRNSLPPAFAEAWRLHYVNDTVQTHLQDTVTILPNLRINAGFRSLLFKGTSNVLENDPAYSGGTPPSGTLRNDAAFLPQFSINYRVTHRQELFFDFSKNMRVFPEAGYNQASPWGSATQAIFNEEKNSLKPETDYVFEGGYRYNSPIVTGLLTLYHTDFHNRLASVTEGNLVNIESLLRNVGNVEMNGVDGTLTLRPVDGLSLTNSISYNSSKYGSNLMENGTFYDLKGKQEVNYPKLMYKTNLSYQYKGAFAHIDVIYMGKRYLSYTNDTHVPSYWLANLGAGYHFGKFGFLKNVTASFNIYNLFNTVYISNMGESGNPLSGDYQSFQIGAPREFFGTISAGF
ncbi:iron complex outermembrane receptor protein [Acidomonas methanolica]|uniref:TonB-dependent receptor n=2 Tax=Acidomonas methanolica TaxID=437 RepID=UPI0010E7E3E8|nr:TonB-dependent receptor [Acidomonas methanolica]TCS30699.1 iron complex outermembrane receptor protein [Acidomonas methanolica]